MRPGYSSQSVSRERRILYALTTTLLGACRPGPAHTLLTDAAAAVQFPCDTQPQNSRHRENALHIVKLVHYLSCKISTSHMTHK